MKFDERVKELVNEDGTAMALTDEQKEFIKRIDSASSTEVHERLATKVNKVDIIKAMESMSQGATSVNSDIFADEIHMTDISGEVHIYPCATSKATNVATADIKEATVYKVTNSLRYNQTERARANAAVRSDVINVFSGKKREDSGCIVKTASMRDFSMSATIFPQDMRFPDEFNKAISLSHGLTSTVMAEFLSETAKTNPSDDVLKTIYRNASRGLAEDVFDSEWKAYNPVFDESDPAQVEEYVSAKKSYMSSLVTIGAMHVSNLSLTAGLSIRKLSIAPNAKWSNLDKLGRVKKFGESKSFYVGTNVDTGMHTVPLTTTIVNKFMGSFLALADYGSALIEKEVRAQNGLAGPIELPDVSAVAAKINKDVLGKPYYELLAIDKAKEAAIYEELESDMKQKAEEVIAAIRRIANDDAAAKIAAMMGR